MKTTCPIPRILLPVDGSDNSRRAVRFAGCLGSIMGKSLTGITLVHVMATSHVGTHAGYVDHRAEVLRQSDAIKKIKQERIDKDIKPFLDEGEKILRDEGVEAAIEKLTLDGDPAQEILRIADDGHFSTILMARHGHSEKKDFLIGITGNVVHGALNQTVYVTGYEVLKDKACPVPRILIPFDGSPYSMKGVEHAACLAGTFKESMSGITLLTVISAEDAAKGEGISSETQRVLDEAKAVFVQAGVPENLVSVKSRIGDAAEEIIEEAKEGDYSLVVLGRKGRSAMKDLILGGVSASVIERCTRPTVAVVGSR